MKMKNSAYILDNPAPQWIIGDTSIKLVLVQYTVDFKQLEVTFQSFFSMGEMSQGGERCLRS